MINKSAKYCSDENCKAYAYYIDENIFYCKKHSKKLIKINNKKICVYENCNTFPNFNYDGMISGIFCSKHKLVEMIDVINKKCSYIGCNKSASYNYKNSATGLYCSQHKLENMIDKKNKTCNYENCNTNPYFNFKKELKPLYCNQHKLKNMINIKDNICIDSNCSNKAYYNYKNEKTKLYCRKHKLDKMVDITRKICIDIDCNITAHYGLLFSNKIHCFTHKNNNEYLKNYPKCIDNCKNKPLYTNDGTNYPKKCENHKNNNDINIVEKPCDSCGLSYYINNKLNLCNDCYNFTVNKIHKYKEKRIKNLLESNNIKYLSNDKIPINACNKYRPDFIIDYIFFMIILEVDENQHKSYSSECEKIRMINLHQDMGGIPVLFIRYNPDEYIDNSGNVIKRNNKYREKILLNILISLKNRKEWDIPLSIYYLFFDGYNDIQELDKINL